MSRMSLRIISVDFQGLPLANGQSARHTCDMADDPNAKPDFGPSYWAKLSPLFRAAHNRLRRARGLPPIPPPKVDRYKPPRGSVWPVDPADPEAVVAAAEFGREVDNNPPDEVFLDWVKESAAACAHTPEEIQQALRDTEYVRRRPRGLLAEYGRVWARAIVADEMEKGSKKDAMVFSAAGQLEVTERTIWAALAPAPAAPPLTKERFRKILADNIEIAERSGNARAAELLRRVAATF